MSADLLRSSALFQKDVAEPLHPSAAGVVGFVNDGDFAVALGIEVVPGKTAGCFAVEKDGVKRIRMFIAQPDDRNVFQSFQQFNGPAFPCDADDSVEPAVLEIVDPGSSVIIVIPASAQESA